MHWGSNTVTDMQTEWFKLIVFLLITLFLFGLAEFYRRLKIHAV